MLTLFTVAYKHHKLWRSQALLTLWSHYVVNRICMVLWGFVLSGSRGSSQCNILAYLPIFVAFTDCNNHTGVSILTHWGRVTHICVSKLTSIGSDNGLSPVPRQATIWTTAGILLIWTLGTNSSEILNAIHTFSFTKMHLKMLSAKWRLFRLGLNKLMNYPFYDTPQYSACHLHVSLHVPNNFNRLIVNSYVPLGCVAVILNW